MRYRELGKTGLKVSEVGLGCGPLGADPEVDYRALLDRALDLGINFYDTADCYTSGRSEEWLGKAFEKKREQVILASKFGNVPMGTSWRKDWSVEYVRKSVEESLRRLRTDYLDLYQLHSPGRKSYRTTTCWKPCGSSSRRGRSGATAFLWTAGNSAWRRRRSGNRTRSRFSSISSTSNPGAVSPRARKRAWD